MKGRWLMPVPFFFVKKSEKVRATQNATRILRKAVNHAILCRYFRRFESCHLDFSENAENTENPRCIKGFRANCQLAKLTENAKK